MNLHVASSHRPSRNGGIEGAEFLFPRRRLLLSRFENRGEGIGPPAYQGWHVPKVMRGNTGGPHASNPVGKDGYKAKPKCHSKCMRESEGRKVPFEVRDNITLIEGSLPAPVMVSKRGRAS